MTDRLSHGKLIFVLSVLAYFFLMYGNGIISLTHPDEVFYSQMVKEMLSSKNWMTPIIFDKPNFEKPIFLYWLMALSLKFFGTSPFIARFIPSFFGIAGVLATYWISFMLFGKKRASFISGVVLSTSFIYIALSRAILTDMVFSVLVVIALGWFYFGYRQDKKRSLGIIFCFVCSGLAVLTKGILGVLFVFVPVLVFLAGKRELDYFKNQATIWGILIFLAITVPWHWLMVHQYGKEFFHEYGYNVHIRRIFEAEHQKSNTWYFYLMVMFGGMFPWAPFLFPAGYLAFRKMKEDPAEEKFAFLMFWIMFVFFGMQVAQSKLASYIFPVFPALAIIIGYYLNSVLEKGEEGYSQKTMRIFSFLISAVLICISVAGIILGWKYSDFVGNRSYPYIFSSLFLGLGVFVFWFSVKKRFPQIVWTVTLITVIILSGLFLGRRYAEPWVSCKNICDVLKQIDHSDSTVLCSKFYVRGVRYYTGRDVAVIAINDKGFFSPHPIPFLNKDKEVLDFLCRQPETYAIVKESDISDLKRITRGKFNITHYDEIGGKHILKIKEIALSE